MKKTLIAALAVSGMAFAADPVKPQPQLAALNGPVMANTIKLACAAGMKQMNDGEGMFCSKSGNAGAEKLDGPYVGINKNGTVNARGQYVQGKRTGHWVFFDEKGIKNFETDFQNDDFHGLRIEFHPNGQKKVEETWLNGSRQVPVKSFDTNGVLLTVGN